jgi:hypothetical protein
MKKSAKAKFDRAMRSMDAAIDFLKDRIKHPEKFDQLTIEQQIEELEDLNKLGETIERKSLEFRRFQELRH